jgi:hypothetical protein
MLQPYITTPTLGGNSQITTISTKCHDCGRQDETVRFVSYPVVFSVVIMTFRRAFTGVWCRKHQRKYRILASLVTTLFGWIGIPFGFIFTPAALWMLAKGGNQPKDANLALLKVSAQELAQTGNRDTAARCLEACLYIQDDDAVRSQLSQFRLGNFTSLAQTPGKGRTALTILGAAALVGAGVGILDYLFTILLSALLKGEISSLFLIILSWTPFLALIFVGGLLLTEVLEWSFVRTKNRSMAFAIAITIGAALIASYGIPEGQAMCDYVNYALAGEGFTSLLSTIVYFVITFFLGGFSWILYLFQVGALYAVIHLLFLLFGAIYYFAISIFTAIRITNWQKRLPTLGND